MTAYYNENDPFAAQWLRNLIYADHIATGIVDDRSIIDVRASDLKGFTQCHFFAGIGIWSRALRDAGWSDDRPVWTGSCPCQPFSGLGQRKGMADTRHLWPAWCDLIRECGPGTVIGEQVASPDALDWLDHVQADMEAAEYAFAAVDMCAAGVGAPHWRQRLWWVGHSASSRHNGAIKGTERQARDKTWLRVSGPSSGAIAMADAHGGASHQRRLQSGGRDKGSDALSWSGSGGVGEPGGMADANGRDAGTEGLQRGGEQRQQPQDCGAGDDHRRPGPVNGFWADADWIRCTDGKWRPVESGTQPLAHGYPQRVGKLRAYGNAICLPAATTFVKAVM